MSLFPWEHVTRRKKRKSSLNKSKYPVDGKMNYRGFSFFIEKYFSI